MLIEGMMEMQKLSDDEKSNGEDTLFTPEVNQFSPMRSISEIN